MNFIDPFGRAITSVHISLTDRCNLRCVYCTPKEGVQWQARRDQLSVDEIVRVVELAAQGGIRRVRLTGGEPLVHPDIIKIVRRIASIPNIEEVSSTTNAMLLERLAQPLAYAGLKRVNISLDTLNRARFKQITRGGEIDRVWKGIAAAERVLDTDQAEYCDRPRTRCGRVARHCVVDNRERLACAFHRSHADRECPGLGRRLS